MARKYYDENGNEVKRGGCLKWGGIAFGVIILIGACGTIFSDSDTQDTSNNEAKTEEVAQESKASAESQEKEEEKVPQEYKNALKKADSYANRMYMSKAGVYDQLTSEYGEGFAPEAAQYAIDNVEADWKENALNKAKSYYEDMALSRDGVYDQLVSEYGEQFTPEEVQYAIDNLPE